MIVLDTSALSGVMHRDPGALDRLRELDPSQVVLCSPVAAEIRFGLERLPDSRRKRMLNSEYEAVRNVAFWVDWTEEAADHFGQVKASLQSEGRIVEDFDLAIASVALDLRVGVATRNPRHFERIDRLVVEDWLD